MTKKLHILNLEDNENDTELIQATLEEEGIACDMTRVETEAGFVTALDKAGFDLLLVDYKLPSFDGMSALAIAREKCSDVPFIFVSGSIGEDMAIEALKNGATDYVLKTKLSRLASAVQRAIKEGEEKLERKRTYEALRQSEDKYRHIVENLGKEYLFYRHNTNGVFTYISPSVADMLGYSQQEALSHYAGFLSDNPINKEVAGHTALSIQGLQQPSYEVEIVHKDRSFRWLEVTEYPVRNQDGRVVAVEGIARDITEHKNADKSRQASLRFLETVHKHMEIKPLLEELAAEIKAYTGCDSVAIRVLDEAGNIPYHAYKGFSTKFVELEGPLSLHSDQCMCINVIKGTTNPRLPFYTEGGSFYMNATTRFLATVSEEDKGKTRNVCNKEGYESVALVPFRSGGRILGLIHVADHRENMVPLKMVEQLESAAMQLGTAFQRANAEAALITSEHQYRQLVDNALVGVYRSTPEGKFLYVNEALARMFECEDAEEMLRLPVEVRYKKPEDREAFLNILKSRGKVPYYEIEVFTKTGKLKTLVISSIFEDGFITGTVTDITERKHLEAQLRHVQKMEAVGTLAGGIAHDFNNILNVILGFGTMLMDRLGDDNLAKEQLTEVLSAADRAANLTRRLLLFSRKEVAEFKPMDVNELVMNMEKMLSRIIGEDINLVSDLMGTKAVVMADAGQMEQVLMNLAANARDAMPEGGSLTIKTELREIDAEFINAYEYGVPGAYAVISITDTGTGIDKEKQARIFDPFFTTKEVGKGTGLGLSIAYGIIKQHNGYIKVYSETGRGATFKMWLPVIEDTAEKKPQVEELSSLKGGTETILVAEDDASLRKMTRTILEAFGYTVITAEDGEDAVAKFMENRERIGLVLLDMIMPKKNGKEAGEAIRKESSLTKIVFVSGYSMETVKTHELIESGFDFIHKPVLPKDLLKKVREVLDK